MVQRRLLPAGAILALLAAGSAHAVELFRTPFPLARKVDPTTYRGPYLTGRDDGGIDYVYDTVDSTSEPANHKVFLQSLDRFGAPKSDPTLVVTAADSPIFVPAGSLALPNGGSFVGYVRETGDLAAAFGRTVGADGVVGAETLVDDSVKSDIFISRMIQLPSSFVVVTDGGYPKSKTGRTTCNFVEADGSITRPQADITFGNKTIFRTSAYQDGLIVSCYRGANAPEFFTAQILDGQCGKIGAPKAVPLVHDGARADAGFALGLTDGRIAVVRFYSGKRLSGFVTVQFHDGGWSKKTPEIVFERPVTGNETAFAAVAGGRLAVASITKTRDGAPNGIKVQAYDGKLRPVGSAAKMTGLLYPTIRRFDVAPDGKLILSYGVAHKTGSRVDLYGQLFSPDM